MAQVFFKNSNKVIDIEEGSSLLKAIRKAEIKLETPCNAMGFCGKCKVIARGKLDKPEASELNFIDIEKHERLACVAKVLGEVEVEILEGGKDLKTIDKGYSISVDIDSPIKLRKIHGINPKSPLPYNESLSYSFDQVNIYKKISKIEEDNKKDLLAVVFKDKVLDLYKLEDKKDLLGIAIDIGTTGVSYYLVDLETGNIINKVSSLNPQTEYGGDVITRTTYCMENSEGPEKLQKLIVEAINEAIENLLDNKYSRENIYHIVVAANTTMAHLLLAVNPASLARAPYRPIFLAPTNIYSKDIGIKTNPNGLLSLIPAASSYVGGDIVSGIMASAFDKNKDGLFIDIGTNGELAALKDGKIISTSTAAGPALEGMNIECGCRAQKGAIEVFHIDEDLNIHYETIGNQEAIGICGSGLIDIAASLVERKILTKTGRWNKKMDEKLKDRLVDKKFYITDKIYISQKDIRQIQLAKGAIAAGILLMLEEINLNLEDIPIAYISGAFGYHINPKSILTIGLIPKGFKGQIKFLGNTSLEGARLALINEECFDRTYKLYKEMKVLELSMKASFQDVFVRELSF